MHFRVKLTTEWGFPFSGPKCPEFIKHLECDLMCSSGSHLISEKGTVPFPLPQPFWIFPVPNCLLRYTQSWLMMHTNIHGSKSNVACLLLAHFIYSHETKTRSWKLHGQMLFGAFWEVINITPPPIIFTATEPLKTQTLVYVSLPPCPLQGGLKSAMGFETARTPTFCFYPKGMK